MDGLFTEEDIKNKYNFMAQCNACSKWTFIINTREEYYGKRNMVCEHCQGVNFDSRSYISKRTFNPLVHNKRKVGGKEKKDK